MANLACNVAKGRAVQFAINVDINSPVNSVLTVIALVVSGDQDDAMRDADTVTALLGLAGVAEATNANYARVDLDDADVTIDLDDTDNDHGFDVPDIALGSPDAGDVWTDLLLCYEPDGTAPADANKIPIAVYDFPVTPDGSAITATVNAEGLYEAA